MRDEVNSAKLIAYLKDARSRTLALIQVGYRARYCPTYPVRRQRVQIPWFRKKGKHAGAGQRRVSDGHGEACSARGVWIKQSHDTFRQKPQLLGRTLQ